jgi:iron complex outermembrane recepter protein
VIRTIQLSAILLAFTACGVTAQTTPVTESTSKATDSTPVQFAILEEVTVTGSRLSSAVADIPTAISVLDSDAISQQFGLSTDLLRALDVRVPGLNVSAGGRSQCLTNIRGRTPSFQINGVPANQDLRPSNCNSAFQLSPFAIDRVEVVRGATALFGAGAPGGIVNIQTRRGTSADPEIDVTAQTSFNTSETDDTFATDVYTGVGQDTGELDYYLGIGYQDYAGARDPDGELIPATEFDSLALNSAIGYEISENAQLDITGTWYEEDPGQEYNVDGAQVDAGMDFPGVIPVDDNPFRDQSRDRLYTLSAALAIEEILNHQFAGSVFYQDQEYRQRANFQDFNGGAPDFFNDNRENSTLGLRATLARDFSLDPVELGIEYGIDLQRNKLIRPLLDIENPAVVVGFIAPEVILNTTGVFLQNDLTWQDFRLTGGVRREYYSGEIGDELAGLGLSGEGESGDFDDANLNLWNAGLVYSLTDDFQLYTSFNQGAELTQLGRAARGADDPSLISPEPAVSDQYEIGARGLVGPVEATFAAFRSKSDAASLVQPDPSCAGESFCPLIPLRVPQKVWGVEGTVNWAAADTIDVGAIFTWQEGEIYDEDVGDYIPFGSDTVSPTRYTAYADWQVHHRVSVSAQATYIDGTSFFSAAEQEFGLVDTDSVFLADASANFEVGPGAINIGVSNLLNESYENVTTAAGGFTPTLAEGRRLTIGYSARF